MSPMTYRLLKYSIICKCLNNVSMWEGGAGYMPFNPPEPFTFKTNFKYLCDWRTISTAREVGLHSQRSRFDHSFTAGWEAKRRLRIRHTHWISPIQSQVVFYSFGFFSPRTSKQNRLWAFLLPRLPNLTTFKWACNVPALRADPSPLLASQRGFKPADETAERVRVGS